MNQSSVTLSKTTPPSLNNTNQGAAPDPLLVTLRQTLKTGAAALPQQIRCILALSQKAAIPQRNIPYPARATNTAEARLEALVNLAEGLKAEKREALYMELQGLSREARLRLSLRLLPHLPPLPDAQLQSLYDEIQQISDPAQKSAALFGLVPLLGDFVETPPEDKDPTHLGQVIRLAKNLENPEVRARSIVALSAHITEKRQRALFRDILQDVEKISSDSVRANTIAALSDHLPLELEPEILHCALGVKSPTERARTLTTLARAASISMKAQIHQHTLSAIENITGEEQRTDALVAFAPYLEPASERDGFPALLEKALTIAISLTRRQIRARALVALAPHLTPDLQREALAAVHSLPNEQERAALLAELVPTLPPDLLIASLAIAHTMIDRDARVQALSALAHHVPAQARAQTVKDALNASYGLSNPFERINAMMALVDALPNASMDAVFRNALETTEQIENENARARAYSLLGSHLPPALLKKALKSAYLMKDPQQRLTAILGVLPRLPVDQRHELLPEMINIVQEMTMDYKRARAVVSIAPYLTTDLSAQAMQITESLSDPFDLASAYIALSQNLPPERQRQVILQAWALIPQIDDGYDRSNVLSAIMPYLPAQQRRDLPAAATGVIQSIHDDYDQASAIAILAPLLAEPEDPPSLADAPSSSSAGHAPSPLPERLALCKQGFKSAFAIPHQALRVQALGQGLSAWERLNTAQRYELWEDIALALTQIPLADTLLGLNTLMPLLEGLYSASNPTENLNMAEILGLG